MSIPPTTTRDLIAVIQRLSLARSMAEIRAIVRGTARRLTGADGVTFILREGSFCHYTDEDAVSPLWKGQRFPIDECVSGLAMTTRRSVVIEDILVDERVPRDFYEPTFVRGLAIVPIRAIEPVGAIGAYWSQPHAATPAETELLQALADSTAVALENVRVYEELDAARLETLQRLALAAEYRDDATFEHTERVAQMAALLGERVGMAPGDVTVLRQAAPLHDIGKLAVSDAILLKPGPLTEEEFEQVKLHAQAGASILSGSTSRVLRVAQEIAETHHEWWDGTGYPLGLAGEEIPLTGRIVALADVYDALTHERPYKDAWPVDRASAEIHRLAGIQFDPAVVAAFDRVGPAALAA